LPSVNFGSDIEFHTPEKPFVDLSSEKEEEKQEEESEEEYVETPAMNADYNTTTSTSTAVYDRNWLLQ
jgi:hypothetical protein